MAGLDLRADLRLGGLALLALALAAYGGWSRAGPDPLVGAAARGGAWQPIDWSPGDAAADAAVLTMRNVWGWSAPPGAPAQAAAAPGPAPVLAPAQTGPWRIVGTADWGQGLAAIIQTQPPGTPKPAFIFRRAGESLPDGRVVVRVEPSRVAALPAGAAAGSEEQAIRLFQPQR